MTTQNGVQQIAVADLVHSASNPASRVTRDIEALAESIGKIGIYQPLIAHKVGRKLVLTDGHRRLEAAKAAGLETVPVIIERDKAHGNEALAQLVTGTMQERLSPWETAQLIAALFKQKMKGVAIAAAVGRSEGWVSKFKTINQAAAKAPKIGNEPAGIRIYAGGPQGGKVKDLMPFGAFTSVDELYAAAQQILDPPAPAGEIPETTAGGEQLDLVEHVDQKALDDLAELGAKFAELFALPASSATTGFGEGRVAVKICLEFSSLKAAEKALKLAVK